MKYKTGFYNVESNKSKNKYKNRSISTSCGKVISTKKIDLKLFEDTQNQKNIKNQQLNLNNEKKLELKSMSNDSRSSSEKLNDYLYVPRKEEETENKLIKSLLSLYIFEISLKSYEKNNGCKNFIPIHLIDKGWLENFKEKYNYHQIKSIITEKFKYVRDSTELTNNIKECFEYQVKQMNYY